MTASRERLTQEQISQAQKWLAETAPILVLDEGNQAMVNRARQLLESGKLETGDAQDMAEILAMIGEARRLGDKVELDNWLEELTDLLYELEE